MIAHRLSTVVNCDKILVLNKVLSETFGLVSLFVQHIVIQGKLVESGTHWELLQVKSR